VCRSAVYLPDELYVAARHSAEISFWCPYGHRQHFAPGDTEEQKLRRERDRLKQQIAEKDDAISRERDLRATAERRVSAQRGVVTRLRNRAAKGVCPCCNRSFENLRRHMTTKHPDFNTPEIGQAAE
jgi:hypothetical protein